jgi:hypothetical protein
MKMLTRTEIAELMKANRNKAAVIKIAGQYRDLSIDGLERLDDHPYQVDVAPFEIVVHGRPKRFSPALPA